MTDFKFGDLICYRNVVYSGHDEPILYIGPCGHRNGRNARGEMTGLIDICALPGIFAEKDPAMWQLCVHLAPLDE